MEDDHRPLLGRQSRKSSIELVANGDGTCRVAGVPGAEHPIRPELHGAVSPMTFRYPIARSHQQAVEPRVEPVRIAQASKVLPGSQESLLHGVLGSIGVAEDQPGRAEHATRAARRERRERIEVALARSYDQIPLDR